MATKKGAKSSKPIPLPEPQVELKAAGISMKLARNDACMVIALAGLGVTIGLYCLAFGLNPFFEGFAKAAEVATLTKTATQTRSDILARIVAGNIIATNMRFCEAERAGRQGEADLYNNQISDLQREYSDYTNGMLYPLRPC